MNQFKTLLGIQDEVNAPLTPEELVQLSNEPESTEAMTELPANAVKELAVAPQSPATREPVVAVPAPESPKMNQEESQLQRLERLAQELQNRKQADLEQANKAQLYRDLLSGVNSNIGLIVGGAQAMNTGAAVNAPRVAEIAQRDLAADVERGYKGNQERLMEQYKALLKAQQQAAALNQRQSAEKEKLDRLDRLEEGRDRRFYAAMGNRENQQDYKKLEFAQNSFNKDKMVVKAEERIGSARTLRDLVTQNTPISAEAAKTFAARASGEVGALSDQDRAAYGGTKAILGRIEQSLQQAATGQLSDSNRKFMLQLSDSFERAGQRDLQTSLKKYAKQTVKRIPNMSEEEAAELLRPDLAGQEPPSQKTSALSKQDAQEQTKEIGGVTYRKVQGGWQKVK